MSENGEEVVCFFQSSVQTPKTFNLQCNKSKPCSSECITDPFSLVTLRALCTWPPTWTWHTWWRAWWRKGLAWSCRTRMGTRRSMWPASTGRRSARLRWPKRFPLASWRRSSRPRTGEVRKKTELLQGIYCYLGRFLCFCIICLIISQLLKQALFKNNNRWG